MQDIFVGRQPIFDRTIKVYAYELLYRHAYVNYAEIEDQDVASCEVMANSLLEIGLEAIVGPHKAFCNFSRGFLLQKEDLSFVADRLVVEVLEHVEAEPEVLEAVEEFSQRGHRIALDDFEYRPELRPLVERADIVKLDVMALTMEQVAEQLKILREIKPSLQFVAEKVETNEIFQQCRDMGFDYFQGYFFSKPKIVSGKKLPPARMAMIRLLGELQNPDVSITEVEKIIESDVYLSVKLLRQINSSYYNLINEVTSIRQAIVCIGLNHIRTWACVLMLGGVSDKPQELLGMALIRAKMCELLAPGEDSSHQQVFFTVGLFSLLDSILDAPMTHVLNSLPLSEEINCALLEHQGKAGEVLRDVQYYEHGNWEALKNSAYDRDKMANAYWESVAWVEKIKASLND
jgi:EAL and modified HD-GYP domain-containing signal transduction protein